MSATNHDVTSDQRADLQAAFRAFGSVSEQLSGAFDSLRGQVAQLQHDLTQAHAGNEHLAARMSALVKGLPGGVLVLDAQGRVVECNPAAIELLGEPVLGETEPSLLQRSVATGGTPGEQIELRSGRFVNLSRRGLAGGGEVVLLTDITEAHLMQVFMARQQRLLTMGELAAGL